MESSSGEIWKPVPGIYENYYAVSNRGRVMRTRAGKGTTGRILKQGLGGAGYFTVALCVDGQPKGHTVHSLVMRAFVGESNGSVINHIDGDKLNNDLSNLEYCTYSENSKHAIRTGLNTIPHKTGEQHNCAKLTWHEVDEIRRLHASGQFPNTVIAKIFNVTPTQVGNIVSGKHWNKNLRVDLSATATVPDGLNLNDAAAQLTVQVRTALVEQLADVSRNARGSHVFAALEDIGGRADVEKDITHDPRIPF